MTEFATFSDLLKTAEHGTSSLYYPQLLRCGRVRVTKDRLESTGEQMYRLDWESVEGMGRDYEGGLVGQNCEMILDNPVARVAKGSELHGTTGVYDYSLIQGDSVLTDTLVEGSSVITSAVLTRATIDSSTIDPRCIVTKAVLRNTFVCPHVVINGWGLKEPLTLENMTIPAYAVIDRPGQVHRLPNTSAGHPNHVAVSATGEVILGGAYMESIRGRERIMEYMRDTQYSDLTYGQVVENMNFVYGLTLPEAVI